MILIQAIDAEADRILHELDITMEEGTALEEKCRQIMVCCGTIRLGNRHVFGQEGDEFEED